LLQITFFKFYDLKSQHIIYDDKYLLMISDSSARSKNARAGGIGSGPSRPGVGAGDGGAAFLSGAAAEDGDLNQYWYSPHTIRRLVGK
jgi:hypothetical protein